MKKIRFITSNYKDLFEINDGDEVITEFSDGFVDRTVCKYIDETHFYYGDICHHICQFAEDMERYGAKVRCL